jgi:hypothetical protein
MRRLCAAYIALCALPVTAQAEHSFKHVVIIFQENRTPDNLFGSNPAFEPGVDIATTGKNSQGQTITLSALPLDDCYDVGHGHASFQSMYNDGKMDGDDRNQIDFTGSCNVPPNPQFTYVDNSTGTVQPYFDLATQYGFANRMFQTNQGPSFPAHQFIFGGTSAPNATTRLFTSSNNLNSAPPRRHHRQPQHRRLRRPRRRPGSDNRPRQHGKHQRAGLPLLQPGNAGGPPGYRDPELEILSEHHSPGIDLERARRHLRHLPGPGARQHKNLRRS